MAQARRLDADKQFARARRRQIERRQPQWPGFGKGPGNVAGIENGGGGLHRSGLPVAIRCYGVFRRRDRKNAGGTRDVSQRFPNVTKWKYVMLNWAVTFLVIALLAALFGFAGIVGAAVGIAKLLFFIFIALFAFSMVMQMIGARRA